jgi:hypothetical protein
VEKIRAGFEKFFDWSINQERCPKPKHRSLDSMLSLLKHQSR